MSSSQKNEILPQECRPAMRADVFKAAIKGNRNVILGCLKLTPEERNEVKVTIDASDPPDTLIQSDVLRSVTPFGDTLLHLLITERHNELALTVFSKDQSLLKVHNKKLETPLHCAALFGNVEVIHSLIQLAPGVVRDALSQTNGNGDTALHVAANHNHENVVHTLMNLVSQAAYKENKQGFSPLYIAIVEGYTTIVKAMLEVDATLACTQFFDGTFPVHVAARMGNTDLLEHFLKEYPDDATLLDSCRRNLFHMSAEHNRSKVVTTVFELTENISPQIRKIVESMINAEDYEGNTPLHIAAMKGHRAVMKVIWNQLNHDPTALQQNQKGKTAFDLSAIQLKDTNKGLVRKINSYIERKGFYFTEEWFINIMRPQVQHELERTQVVGLCSILIITVTFAAAFTIPGGYTNDGAPVLGKRYMFRAFVLANTMAFILSLTSVFILVNNALLNAADEIDIRLAGLLAFSAGNCMIVAFGLGLYVMLASVSLPIAVIVLTIALLFASPIQLIIVALVRKLWKLLEMNNRLGLAFEVVILYMLPLLLIFFPAFQ